MHGVSGPPKVYGWLRMVPQQGPAADDRTAYPLHGCRADTARGTGPAEREQADHGDGQHTRLRREESPTAGRRPCPQPLVRTRRAFG